MQWVVGKQTCGVAPVNSRFMYIMSYHRDYSTVMPNIAEEVCKEVNKCLQDREAPVLSPEIQDALKAQVIAVGDKGHSVHQLLG